MFRLFVAIVSVATLPSRVLLAQDTTRVSTDSTGAEGNGDSSWVALSADGAIVAFQSDATNLVANDTDGMLDIFVCDRVTGIVTRVNVDSSGAEANAYCYFNSAQSLSADGNRVAFVSMASNLCANDTNGTVDVFVHDRASAVTERVSVDSSGSEANSHSDVCVLSSDGNFVAFASAASNLVSNDTNLFPDVFVHDLSTGSTERVSVDSSGGEADGDSGATSISADGRFVAFASVATNLVSGDKNQKQDIFVRDRLLGMTERVSVSPTGGGGNGWSDHPSISDDGRFVAFLSYATNLVANDTNGVEDAFVFDRATATMVRANVDAAGAETTGDIGWPTMSLDGRVVTFDGTATDLVAGDTNQRRDCFVHDLATGATARISVDSTGAEGNDDSFGFIAISADHGVFAFASVATNLIASDTNGFCDVFVHEACSLPAAWSNYGVGLAGTLGVPALVATQLPVLGSTIAVDVGNSLGAPTIGVLLFGTQRGAFHTKFGADVLVAPTLLVPITFSYGSDSFSGVLPTDSELCGTSVDLQVLELDPGAPFGVSFTPGLDLALGR
jgi:Tol biopolymer transport system component